MGARVWQKNGASGRTSAAQLQQTRAERSTGGNLGQGGDYAGHAKPQKRKLVWIRDNNSSNGASHVPPSATAVAPNVTVEAIRTSCVQPNAAQRLLQGVDTRQSEAVTAERGGDTMTRRSQQTAATTAAKRQNIESSKCASLNASARSFHPPSARVGTSDHASTEAHQSSASAAAAAGGLRTSSIKSDGGVEVNQPVSLHFRASTSQGPSDSKNPSRCSAGASNGEPKAPTVASAAAAAAARQKQHQQRRQAALTKKMQDVSQLRREVHNRQRRLSATQAAQQSAEEKAKAAADATAIKARHSRQHLQTAFAEAFQEAAQQAAVEAAAPRPSAPPADVTEVARVLSAVSDYECLKVVAGAKADVIRQRYREMAKALHPDKCGVAGAKDAFQRLFAAYTNLRSYVA